MRTSNLLPLLAGLAGLLLSPPPALEAARAPTGRYYAVLQIEHVSGPPTMSIRRACLRFERKLACDEEGSCGPFVVDEKWPGGNRWSGVIDKTDLGEEVELVLLGFTETVGPKSSIGGTLISNGKDVGNGGFVGLQTKRKQCLAFAVGEPEPGPPPDPGGCTPPARCCKICSTGKACGDTCIAKSLTCRKTGGCACNRSDVCPTSTVLDLTSFPLD